MEWAIGVPFILLMALACPLMMVGMMAFGWLFMRGRSGSHTGSFGAAQDRHGMMMCMGHGGGNHEEHHQETKPLVEELKAERERLDRIITRAEEETKGS
jgi:hypothetical protein